MEAGNTYLTVGSVRCLRSVVVRGAGQHTFTDTRIR